MDDRVVVGVDGSAWSRRALAWAAEEAALRGARLQAVVAWRSPADRGAENPFPVPDSELAADAGSRLERSLADAAGTIPAPGPERLVVRGDPATTLCDLASGASLLVVGRRGRGALAGAVLGSVSLRCAHHSPCPVAVVGSEAPARPPAGRIVVGVDRSAGSVEAMEWALDEARLRGWEVEAVEVVRDPYQEDMALELDMPHFRRERPRLVRGVHERLERFVARTAGGKSGVAVTPVLVVGDPDSTLCERSTGADLLVLGSRGRGGLSRVVLGSVSSSCAHRSRCPVVIVPGEPTGRPAPVR